MKKVLVVLLVLCVGAGAFAQEITPYGSLRLDFGGSLINTDGTSEGAYKFDAGGAGTGIGVSFEGDNFHGNVHYSPGDYSGGLKGNGTVTLADVLDLTIGLDWLPSAFWSPLAIFGDSNWSVGATSIGQVPYFKIGAFGAYLGAGAPAVLILNGERTPVFFAGYDFTPESNAFTVGVSVTFQSAASGKGGLPLQATLHGRVSPSETIHILGNVGFYMTPAAFGGLAPVYGDGIIGASADSLALEGFIGASIGITDTFGIDVTFGGKGDLSKGDITTGKDGGGSLIKAGLDANIKLNDNFTLTPGVIFTKPLKAQYAVDPKMFMLDYGVSLKYSF